LYEKRGRLIKDGETERQRNRYICIETYRYRGLQTKIVRQRHERDRTTER
jgi:hypothetical protein